MRRRKRVYNYIPYKIRLIRKWTAIGVVTALLAAGGVVIVNNINDHNSRSINTIPISYADDTLEETPTVTTEPIIYEEAVAIEEPIVTPEPVIYHEPVATEEPIVTPEPFDMGYCVGTGVNVRAYPSTTNTKILTSINKGDQVKIFGEDSGFYNVEVNGTRGYVAKRYIVSNKVVNTVTVKGTEVRVRSLPNTKDSSIIFEAYNGQTFEYVRDYNKDWVEAIYQGRTVYISSKYVVKGESPVNEFQFYKLAYLKREGNFYGENGEYLCSLPQNEVCEVIGEDDSKYHVIISGVKGYVNRDICIDVDCTIVIDDLELQGLTVYHNNGIIMKAPFLSGDVNHITPIGGFINTTLHPTYHMTKYGDNTYENVVSLVGDYFMHPGPNVKENNGKLGRNYPVKGGSHGCIRLYPETAEFIYNLLLNERNNHNKYIVIVKGPSPVKKIKSLNITPNMNINAKFYQSFTLPSKDAIYHDNSYNSKIKTLNKSKGYC